MPPETQATSCFRFRDGRDFFKTDEQKWRTEVTYLYPPQTPTFLPLRLLYQRKSPGCSHRVHF